MLSFKRFENDTLEKSFALCDALCLFMHESIPLFMMNFYFREHRKAKASEMITAAARKDGKYKTSVSTFCTRACMQFT